MPELHRTSPNVLTPGDVVDSPTDGFRYRITAVGTGQDGTVERELVGAAAPDPVDLALAMLWDSGPPGEGA